MNSDSIEATPSESLDDLLYEFARYFADVNENNLDGDLSNAQATIEYDNLIDQAKSSLDTHYLALSLSYLPEKETKLEEAFENGKITWEHFRINEAFNAAIDLMESNLRGRMG